MMPFRVFAMIVLGVIVAAAGSIYAVTSLAPAISLPILGVVAMGLTIALRKING